MYFNWQHYVNKSLTVDMNGRCDLILPIFSAFLQGREFDETFSSTAAQGLPLKVSNIDSCIKGSD